jgi:hypothetical protein
MPIEPVTPKPVEVEDIEEMRRQEGIDDVELRIEIRSLKVGDSVRLTFRDVRTFETVPVRLTQIRGTSFRGKLLQRALTLAGGSMIAFTVAHIHSVVKKHDMTV